MARKTLLDKKERKRILRMVQKDPVITVPEIKKRLKKSVSITTIRKVLVESGCERVTRPRKGITL